jgi:hypothetical protein
LVKETKRSARVEGKDWVELSLNLISDTKRKNDALKRALALYRACRAT